jgi:hypothetical protein
MKTQGNKIRTILYILTLIVSYLLPICYIILRFLDYFFCFDMFNLNRISNLQKKIETLEILKNEEEKFQEQNQKTFSIFFISFLFFVGTFIYYVYSGNPGPGDGSGGQFPPALNENDPGVKIICSKIGCLGELIIKFGFLLKTELGYRTKNREDLSKAAQSLNSSLYQSTVINKDLILRSEDRQSNYFEQRFLVLEQFFFKNNIDLNLILEKLLTILKKIDNLNNENCFDDINDNDDSEKSLEDKKS